MSMPTYEYACTSCGHHLEVFQSFSEEPLTSCPSCGGDLRKVFGSIGIVLKGSGFYRNDSRTSSNGRSASKDKDGSKEKDGSKDKEKKDGSSTVTGSGSAGSGSKQATPAPASSSTPSGAPSKSAAAAG
jgi:putative FmdB family regulatory protein